MMAVDGYFDGNTIRFLNPFTAKTNQRVIVTVLDEVVNVAPKKLPRMRGALAQYANPALMAQEKSAWADAAEEKHAHS
ncbi:MAG: hypothetical protein MR375_07390 [Veillonellaceae bacterium]|nr:hypothetical protein [Veillonellaceae bacterium]